MKVKLLTETAKAPTRGTEQAAGYDIYADMDGHDHIVKGKAISVSTGIAVQIPHGFVGLIQPRSGLAFKKSVDTMACVIDSDYTGEIKLLLTCHNDYHETRIERGDRLAQLVVVPCYNMPVELVDSLENTERAMTIGIWVCE